VTTAIQILRIREGQIVLFRDFADSRVLEDAIREPPGKLLQPEMPGQLRRGKAAATGQEPAGQSQQLRRNSEGERCSRA
jgi:hypothetical protein